MSPEVAKLVHRAIVDYLDGQNDEFFRLVNKAMQINGELTCRHCGGIKIECKYGHKNNKKRGYLCTDCGEVTIEDTVVKEGKRYVS